MEEERAAGAPLLLVEGIATLSSATMASPAFTAVPLAPAAVALPLERGMALVVRESSSFGSARCEKRRRTKSPPSDLVELFFSANDEEF